MDDLIKLAREFLESILLKQKNNIKEEHYFMFLISKFLLLKETIIKKDSDNNTLYFDFKQNSKYLHSIFKITDYVRRNGEIIINSTRVIIRNSDIYDKKIEESIWIFNKIRDSFAHGMYQIDLENKCIVINNDHQKERDPYLLKCEIPLTLLEMFNYLITKNDNEEENFEEYRDTLRNEFEYINNKKYIYDNKINNDYYELLNDNYKDYDDYIYKNDYLNKKINYSEKYIDLLRRMSYKELLQMLLMMLKDNNFDKDKILAIIAYLEEKKLIKNNELIYEESDDYKIKIYEVIREISEIIGINNVKKGVIALYNYMQLTFAHRNINYRGMDKNDVKKTFGYLKLREFGISYIKYQNNQEGFNNDLESQYSLKIKAINNYCISFIEIMKQRLKQYENYQNNQFRRNLMDSFAKFYDDIITSLASKNSFIISSMRNAVEHGNIGEIGNYVVLYDQSNQDDNKSINFYGYGKLNDFYQLTKNVEFNNGKDEFTINDFLLELKNIVDKNIYDELIDILQEFSMIIFGKQLELDWTMDKMYIEALNNIIRKGIKNK